MGAMPAWLRSTVAKSFLWLLTTLGAAALGGLATSYIDRPTPAAAITGIHISEKYNDLFGKNQIVQIQLNSSLFRHINQSVWTPRFEKQSINLTNIIKILSDDLDNIDRLVEDLNNFEHA